MALCRDQQSTGDAFIESDVIVLGSMSMLDVNLVQNSAYNNAEYFVGLLNSVCGKEDSIVVASKDLTQTSISASASDPSGRGIPHSAGSCCGWRDRCSPQTVPLREAHHA